MAGAVSGPIVKACARPESCSELGQKGGPGSAGLEAQKQMQIVPVCVPKALIFVGPRHYYTSPDA